MSGFRNVAQWVAAIDAGQTHITTFRKTVASAATLANDFIDYTYFSGNPPANFYASAPLEAAFVESIRGISLPTMTGVSKQFLKSLMLMTAASGAAITTNQNQKLTLHDYLLYYPFIDTDAVGELQEMVPLQTIPRYASGQLIAVAQSASSAIGQFTVTYTNQNGVGGRVSANTFTKVVAGGGALVSSTNNAVSGSQQYIELQAGDSGVKSVESVTFTAAGGGLLALVIVKPLFNCLAAQECRRNTDLSIGSATYYEALCGGAPPIELKNGAVLGFTGLGNAGSLASSIFLGMLQTVWS